MKKNGRTKGLPGLPSQRDRGFYKGLGAGGKRDKPCSLMNEWWQIDTKREVRAKQCVVVLIMSIKIINVQCQWVSRNPFIVYMSFISSRSFKKNNLYTMMYSIMNIVHLHIWKPFINSLVSYIHDKYREAEREGERKGERREEIPQTCTL